MKWIIHDWAGNHLFREKVFDSFEDGWERIRTQFPDAEDDWQEYYVVPQNGKPDRE